MDETASRSCRISSVDVQVKFGPQVVFAFKGVFGVSMNVYRPHAAAVSFSRAVLPLTPSWRLASHTHEPQPLPLLLAVAAEPPVPAHTPADQATDQLVVCPRARITGHTFV